MTPIHPSKVAPAINGASNITEMITPLIQFMHTLGYVDIKQALENKLIELVLPGSVLPESAVATG